MSEEAGPSRGPGVKDTDDAEDTDAASGQEAPKKTVRWDTEEMDDTDDSPPPMPRGRRDSVAARSRRQSLVGTTGYVTQLLEQYVDEEEPENKEESYKKPIRQQSMAERRASVRAVGVDMEYYMQGMMKPSKKSTKQAKTFPKLISKEKLEEIITFSTLTATDSRESSTWAPTQLFQEEPDSKQAVSWVGAYIIGKDYWKEQDFSDERDEKVSYIADGKMRPWYDVPLKKSIKDSVFQKKKYKSLEKIEALKVGHIDNYDEIRRGRLEMAEYARQEETPLESLDEEFKLYFQDVCKSSDFLHREHRISMAELDKWLERAGILDYSRLTLINTGLCFIASGGSKHKGLSYIEFTQFLQMISLTTGKSMKEIVLRMQAAQRGSKS